MYFVVHKVYAVSKCFAPRRSLKYWYRYNISNTKSSRPYDHTTREKVFMTCPAGTNTQDEHNDDVLVFEPGFLYLRQCLPLEENRSVPSQYYDTWHIFISNDS